MLSLIWKEWHEQNWKLWFGCIVLGTLAGLGLRDRIIADRTMVMWVCLLGLAILPVLTSTGLVPAERAEGAFESLLALPVSPRRILLCKTLMGILLCIGPMLVAMVLSVLAAGGREMTNTAMILFYAKSTATTLSMFVWMLALTSRLPSEARGALIGIGLLVFWLLATVGLDYPGVPPLALAISPLVFVHEFSEQAQHALPAMSLIIAVQLIISILLWVWTSTRLTGVSEGRS